MNELLVQSASNQCANSSGFDSSCFGNSLIAKEGLLSEPRISVGQPPRVATLRVLGWDRRSPLSRQIEQFAKASMAIFFRQQVAPPTRKQPHAGRGQRCIPVARHGPPSTRGDPRSCRGRIYSTFQGTRKASHPLMAGLCTASIRRHILAMAETWARCSG